MPISSPTYALGSWTAGDTGIADANGTVWGVRPGTQGVFDGAPIRLNQSPFPNADGAQRSRSFRTPRPFVLAGWARGTTTAGAEASRRSFVDLLAGGGQSPLTITYLDGLVVTAAVELADAPKATPASGSEFDWQLTLSAIDPSLYGPTGAPYQTPLPTSSSGLDWSTGGGLDWSTGGGLNWGVAGSNGLVTVVNSGGQESWPVFTINAATDGATLINPIVVDVARNNQLAYTDTLVLGDVVVITTNPINRGVTKNGVPYRANLTTAQWFSIPPNSSLQIQFQGTSTSTTPQLSVSVPPAY